MQTTGPETLEEKLDRLIEAISRLAPRTSRQADFAAADCFVWSAELGELEPVARVNRVDIGLIRGVDRVRDILVDNTERFASGLPANNVLLWGARGMGKSSLVKAAHATVNEVRGGEPLKLIEIHREDIDTLPKLMAILNEETAVATQTRLNADFVPGIVSVLSGDELEAMGIETAWEALSLVAGVQALQ